jgi:hypothetical protein
MAIVLLIVRVIHVLAAVFWAGSTFALARSGGSSAASLFRPQMSAAGVALATGGYLWTQSGLGFSSSGTTLLLGAVCAVAAAVAQGVLAGPALRTAGDTSGTVRRAAIAHRIASALLTLTLIAMVVAPYV